MSDNIFAGSTVLRIEYKKYNKAILLSHLNVMNLFLRILRQVNLTMKYTQGYRKHPVITMSWALPLGVESECEFIDIALNSKPDNLNLLKSKINELLPEGFEVVSLDLKEGKPTNFNKLFYGAVYEIVSENLIEENIEKYDTEFFKEILNYVKIKNNILRFKIYFVKFPYKFKEIVGKLCKIYNIKNFKIIRKYFLHKENL